MRRSPGFTAVAVLTLALGTGANTAIFELVDAVSLRTLPVDRPEQLVEVRIAKTREGRTGSFMGNWPNLSNPLWERIRAEQRVFSSMLAWGATRARDGGLHGAGALGPVEAYGLDALREGCAEAGIVRV